MKRARTLLENPVQPTTLFLGGLLMGFLGGLAAARLANAAMSGPWTPVPNPALERGTVGSFASIEKSKVSEGTKAIHPVLQHG